MIPYADCEFAVELITTRVSRLSKDSDPDITYLKVFDDDSHVTEIAKGTAFSTFMYLSCMLYNQLR